MIHEAIRLRGCNFEAPQFAVRVATGPANARARCTIKKIPRALCESGTYFIQLSFKEERQALPLSNAAIDRNIFGRYSHECSIQCLTTGSRER
jgi:hypothetical protein